MFLKMIREPENIPNSAIEYYTEESQIQENPSRNSLGKVEEIGIFPLGVVLNPGVEMMLNEWLH